MPAAMESHRYGRFQVCVVRSAIETQRHQDTQDGEVGFRLTLRNDGPGPLLTPSPAATLLRPHIAASSHCVLSPPRARSCYTALTARVSQAGGLVCMVSVVMRQEGTTVVRVKASAVESE